MEGVLCMDSFTFNVLIRGGMGIFTALMFTACLYFILTYFEYIKKDDKRLIKQSKLWAVIALFLALGSPAIYQFYLMMQ